MEAAATLPVNLTVSPASNSDPVPDNVSTFAVDVLSTCSRENITLADTAAGELPNPLPMTSIKESIRELLTEVTKKSLIIVSCDDMLLEDEYELDAKSVMIRTLPSFCGCNVNAGIFNSNSFF